MEIKVLPGGKVMQRMIGKDLTATNCDVRIDAGDVNQLNEVKLINCVIQSEGHQILTNEKGEIYSESHYNTWTPPKIIYNRSDIYKDEGIAIYVKGKLVYGIHPDNVENNVEALDNGSLKFDWKQLLKNAEGGEEK